MYSGATDLIGYANNVTLEGRGGSCMYRFVGRLVYRESDGTCWHVRQGSAGSILAARTVLYKPVKKYTGFRMNWSISHMNLTRLKAVHISLATEPIAHMRRKKGKGIAFSVSLYTRNKQISKRQTDGHSRNIYNTQTRIERNICCSTA